MADWLIHPRRVVEAHIERVVDGDTMDVVERPATRLRLLGLNTAEVNRGPEESRTLGNLQTEWVEKWFDAHPELIIDDRGPDPFGRRLSWVYSKQTRECLNFAIVRRWPKTARNPRLMAAEIFGKDPQAMAGYKPA